MINLDWTIHTKPLIYNDCNCGLSWKCVQPSRGMMVGCYPLEVILQSTLHCFYDQDCIDSNGTFSKLDNSSLKTSRFNLNSTIESILNHLMVEEYSTNISYQTYFHQCAPSSCTHSYVARPNTIEIIISLISLYGGLVIITRCIAVIITKLCFNRRHRISLQITQ